MYEPISMSGAGERYEPHERRTIGDRRIYDQPTRERTEKEAIDPASTQDGLGEFSGWVQLPQASLRGAVSQRLEEQKGREQRAKTTPPFSRIN